LQNNEEVRPIFDGWLEPLKSVGVRRNVIEPVGSTDHLSFHNVGVPGFNPIQDYVNYDIRTHHTNMDTADRLDINDIRQAAVVMAVIRSANVLFSSPTAGATKVQAFEPLVDKRVAALLDEAKAAYALHAAQRRVAAREPALTADEREASMLVVECVHGSSF